jgi:hypothetical protein
MKSDELKDILEKARDDGIIKCVGLENLKCPFVDYQLFNGWCIYRQIRSPDNKYKCIRGADRGCFHKVDVFYEDGPPDGVMLIVRYRYSPEERIGFIPDSNNQLRKILRKIDSAHR